MGKNDFSKSVDGGDSTRPCHCWTHNADPRMGTVLLTVRALASPDSHLTWFQNHARGTDPSSALVTRRVLTASARYN